MNVHAIQLCQGPDVIAELTDDRWFVNGNEVVDNEDEVRQLYHCLSGDFTGYMVFRAVEYEDVQICVVFQPPVKPIQPGDVIEFYGTLHTGVIPDES